jgi:hypothetical protein
MESSHDNVGPKRASSLPSVRASEHAEALAALHLGLVCEVNDRPRFAEVYIAAWLLGMSASGCTATRSTSTPLSGIVVIVCGNQKIPRFEPLLYLSLGSGVRKPTLRGASSVTAGELLPCGCSESATAADDSNCSNGIITGTLSPPGVGGLLV